MSDDRPSRRRPRGLTALCAAVVLVGAVGAGWLAAAQFESPAQKEARASPPPAGPVLAAVERGALEQTFTANATVRAASRLSATVPSHEGGGYVTAKFASPGDTVGAGRLLLEVNSAPAFAIRGDFPFYRDLGVGDIGRDVRQLQQGLNDAGLSVTVDGHFGSATAGAVATLFERAAYPVPTRASATAEADPPQPSSPSAAGVQPAPSAASTAPYVPLSDLVVFTNLPVSLVSAPAVGTQVNDETTVSAEFGERVAAAAIGSSVAVSVKPGMTGAAEHGGATVPITVASVTRADGEESAGVVVVPAHGSSFPADWNHRKVLITVVLAKSAENALLVPSNAIATDGKSGGTLLVQTASGSFRRVDITEIAELNGRSAVEVRHGAQLDAGDQVRID